MATSSMISPIMTKCVAVMMELSPNIMVTGREYLCGLRLRRCAVAGLVTWMSVPLSAMANSCLVGWKLFVILHSVRKALLGFPAGGSSEGWWMCSGMVRIGDGRSV